MGGYAPCGGCGRRHVGGRVECHYRPDRWNHEDFNPLGAWESSDIGRAYKALGESALMKDRKLSPNRAHLVARTIAKTPTGTADMSKEADQGRSSAGGYYSKGVSALPSINATSSLGEPVSVYLRGSLEARAAETRMGADPVRVRDDEFKVLLDSGSLAGDFITKAASERIRRSQCRCPVAHKPIGVLPTEDPCREYVLNVICSPCGCVNVNESIDFTIFLFDDENGICKDLAIQAGVLETDQLDFDILIGRDTLARYDLYSVFREHLRRCLSPASAEVTTPQLPDDASLNPTVAQLYSKDSGSPEETQTTNQDHGDVRQISKALYLSFMEEDDGSDLYNEKYEFYNNIPRYVYSIPDVKVSACPSDLTPVGSHTIPTTLHAMRIRDKVRLTESSAGKGTVLPESGILQEDMVPTGQDPEQAETDRPDVDNLKPQIFGPPSLIHELENLVLQYESLFRDTVSPNPAAVKPMKLKVRAEEWEVPRNSRAPRAQPLMKQYAIAKFVEQARLDDVIEPCEAEFASQVLLIPKPNGSYRFCIDYRALNQATANIGWPLPNIKQMLNRIGQHRPKYFGVMDLTQGFYQCPLDVESRDYSAFITYMGTYRWKRVPMGLKGAPSYFQRQMASKVLNGLLYRICELYIDDIILWGESEDSFVLNVREVLDRLGEYNVTLNPKKCRLGLAEVEYVGHTLNDKGMAFSDRKIRQVLDFALPHNLKTLQSFLGLANYMRDHVLHYDRITQPLYDLQTVLNRKKSVKTIEWTPGLLAAFKDTQTAIQNCSTLFYVNYANPLYLNTDASDYGIGAVLYQMEGTTVLPIQIISKSLTGAQMRWSTFEKECYAIFYAVTNLEYLLRDVHFILRTDHRNLTFLNESNMSKVQRWKLAIQHFIFDIEHVSGKDNIIADALSHNCHQSQPPLIAPLFSAPHPLTIDAIHFVGSLSVRPTRDIIPYQLPKEAFDKISRAHNAQVGHNGVDATIRRLRNQGEPLWSGARRDIQHFIRQCPFCQKNAERLIPVSTEPYTVSAHQLFERVAVDTIGPLPTDIYGNQYIIVMIDAFSRMVELYPAPSTEAVHAANALLHWVCRYGVPYQLRSDNGTQFVNELITTFCELYHIDHHTIAAYSHEQNGLLERANKQVLNYLRAMVFEKNIISDWSALLPMVQKILNSQVHSVLKVSPVDLVFGHSVNLEALPVSYVDTANRIESVARVDYKEWLEAKLSKQALLLATAYKNQSDEDLYQLARIPDDITEFPLNSYVLQRYENDEHRPPHKLNTRLRGPHKVISKRNDGEVDIYTVENLATNKLEDFKVMDLQPFNYDPAVCDPREIAYRDKQMYAVEAIRGHTGSRTQRAKMRFLVKWLGYPEEENTWEPWAHIKDNRILHEYLREHKMGSLVPKRYAPPATHAQTPQAETAAAHGSRMAEAAGDVRQEPRV